MSRETKRRNRDGEEADEGRLEGPN